MYLHGLDGSPNSEKEKLLEKTFGKQSVKGVNLKTRQTIMLFTAIFSFVVLLSICIFVTCFVLLKWFIALSATLVGIICLIGGYWLAGRGVTHFMMQQACRIAEKKFKDFRPNVIVAETFGAVVALSMDVPKVALLLLAPAQDQFARFMKSKSHLSINEFPYVMVVHGSHDKSIPLDDSVRLIETSEVGRCRLEVVDDNHALKGVTAEDLENWVKEVYSLGREQVQKMVLDGNKKVDMSLFKDDDVDETKPSGDNTQSV